MKELKAGDVVDVVESRRCKDCIFLVGPCDAVPCNEAKLSFRLCTGPKQGDTVWVRSNGEKWIKANFVAKVDGKQKTIACVMDIDCECEVSTFEEMTTENPYAIKYTLTPQEARHAAIDGAKVRRGTMHDGFYFKWSTGFGLRAYNSKDECIKSVGDLEEDYMYAIIEEE